MTRRAELLHLRIQHALRQCRLHRFNASLIRTDPVGARASQGYSYYPTAALREHQRDLVGYRRDRQAVQP